MRHGRVIFSGTRRQLTERDIEKVRALVLHYAGRYSHAAVGDCPTGIDALVRQLLGGDVHVFEADWERFGKRAGPERNGQMIEWAAGGWPSLLVAFPCPQSRGTWDAIRRAVSHGVRVVIEPMEGEG